jgi:hypothetical protein
LIRSAGGSRPEAVAGLTRPTRLSAWKGLHDLVDGLMAQVCEVMPVADQAALTLKEFEARCRATMDRIPNSRRIFHRAWC